MAKRLYQLGIEHHVDEELGVGARMVSRWELGRARPNQTYTALLSLLFGLPPEQLDLPRLVLPVVAPMQATSVPYADANRIVVRIGPGYGDVITLIVNRREFLEAVGGALVTAATVQPMTVEPAPGHPVAPELTRLLFGPHERDGTEVVLYDLDASVNCASQVWTTDAQRYTAVRSLLPQLTADVEQSVRQFRRPQEARQRRGAYQIAAHHYFLLRSFFRAVGRFDLATVCADRGLSAAEAAADPILVAGARWNVATVLLIDDQASLGREIVMQAANAIAPMREKDRQAAAMYGALHLTAASAAVRAGLLAVARDHIWLHAEPIARLTGEANVLWTQFDPVNVHVIAVGVEMALGNSAEALSLADRIDATRLPSVERRATFLLEVARSYEQRGEDMGVLHYLTRAEQEAPEDMRYQPLASSLVQGLLARSRPILRPDVEALATRAGLQN